MNQPGTLNLLTDVSGLRVGNAQDPKLRSGVTVILCEQATVAAVAIQGGAPGSRETALLRPECLVERIDALVFSGGSVFGLDAASAVTTALAQQGRGFPVQTQHVPIVPAAILFDLLNGGDKPSDSALIYRDLAQQALIEADVTFQLGNSGAGLGATAGPLKGGLGSASWVLNEGYTVGALAVVNAFGSATLPDSPLLWAWPFEQAAEMGNQRRLLNTLASSPALRLAYNFEPALASANTSLCVVATDAPLNKVQATRLALMAQAGLARALRPVFTPFDGDSVFALATAATGTSKVSPKTLGQLGLSAADCLSRAVGRGIFEAASLPAWPGYREVYRDFFPTP